MSMNDSDLLGRLLDARSTAQVEAIMASLPIVSPEEYQWFSADERSGPWQKGKLHWVPVGRDRGNGGRIKLAGEPMNPLAERLVNGMESLIELARLRELQKKPAAVMQASPRAAVLRYFEFPKHSIERLDDDERKEKRALVDKVRKNLSITLDFEKRSRQFAVTIRDHGMGQTAANVHNTLLSLGRTDKADKPYLIGVFGQGGSSAFSIAKYSVVVSRRASDLRKAAGDADAGPITDLGTVSIRVFVLPPKPKKGAEKVAELPLDLQEGEEFMLDDKGATPVASYLEASRGKRCIVYLVNGQRQEFDDNGFIVQDLGFRYLRSRMMIMVDVDGLAPEAIGRLMQGSRQTFYRGAVREAITFEGGLFPGYALVPVRPVDAVKLAQERGPGQRPACLRRHGLGLLPGRGEDARIDGDELPAAGLSAHLDHARRFEGIEH